MKIWKVSHEETCMFGFKSRQPQVLLADIDSLPNGSGAVEKYAHDKRFRNVAISEPSQLQEFVKAQLPSLAKWEVEALTKTIREHYVNTYKHRVTPKYRHQIFRYQHKQEYTHTIGLYI